jgi:selT/selW/selH-like putative selenoprotein
MQPPISSQIIAQLCSYIFFLGLFILFAGETVFQSLGFELGVQFARKLKDNQMIVVGILFFANVMSSSLLSTGAFEVYYNGELVHSKLNSGQLPDYGRMLRQLHKSAGDSNAY